MSADNWATCPKCKDAAERTQEALAARLRTDYGVISRDDYKALEVEVSAGQRALDTFGATFREDYEFYGAEDGTVTASYRGSCSLCGLTAKMEHSVTFYPESGSAS